MDQRILCTADLHIGRNSSGFEGHAALSALETIVNTAVDERADCVLIAGDFFDSQAAQYLFRKQTSDLLARLRQANIPVLAVAGNHDYEALPTFCNAHPNLINLFSSQEWEFKSVQGLHVVGRSFDKPTSGDLFQSFPSFTKAAPTVGLVHADIDARSRYNPSPLTSFSGRGVDAWIVGHVHASKKWEQPIICYPGSPMALDPGETGIHGFRWLEINRATFSLSEVVLVSTVRYETIVVEIGPQDGIDEVIGSAIAKMRVGNERIFARVHLKRMPGSHQEIPRGPVQYAEDLYEVVRESEHVSLDLEFEALQSDAAGQAARLLLGLRGEGQSEWVLQANALVDSVAEDIRLSKRQLKINESEEFARLASVDRFEATQCVVASLEKILATGTNR
jgi:DNA repair exonuclease SbcCD nuclease subunit